MKQLSPDVRVAMTLVDVVVGDDCGTKRDCRILPTWMPRGLVVSSLASSEIAVPSPMSIFHPKTNHWRPRIWMTSHNASRSLVAQGAVMTFFRGGR